MPITKQAAKKLRHDRVRSVQNAHIKKTLTTSVKKARKAPSEKTISLAYQAVDRAAKHHSIHKNTAARLKSRLAKLLKR